jgi:hypothetical protein
MQRRGRSEGRRVRSGGATGAGQIGAKIKLDADDLLDSLAARLSVPNSGYQALHLPWAVVTYPLEILVWYPVRSSVSTFDAAIMRNFSDKDFVF